MQASTIQVGFEDWKSPASDYDYNDAELNVSGLTFHTLAPWTFTPPPGYHETPFPAPADYFDYAISSGPALFAYIGAQSSSAAVDMPYVSVNSGPWQLIGHGTLTLNTSPGDRIYFALLAGPNWLYADPARNSDSKGYAVVSVAQSFGPPPSDPGTVPEPATFALTGIACIAIAWRLRR
jgi:hypothetical protein